MIRLHRYYITDRQRSGSLDALLRDVARVLQSGVEMIQIREKDLATRELLSLTEQIRQLPNPHGTKLLLNTRLDLALAAGLDGVHLTSTAPAPARLRPLCPTQFLIGVSCHTLRDVQRAGEEGGDFAVFGPVFPVPGKGQPVGLEGLRRATAVATLPVFALGGVTWGNAQQCQDAGASGIAGIRLFGGIQ